jgi:hypothetical protein
MGAPDVLRQLRKLGVTVNFDRPTGQLRARPVPLPDRARELIQANHNVLAFALALDAHIVGDLVPVDGDALDSYSEWVARKILGVKSGRRTHPPVPLWITPLARCAGAPGWPAPTTSRAPR